MYLKFGYSVLYTPIYRLTKRKTFPCTKLSMWNRRYVNRLCAQDPRARQGSCRMTKLSITEGAQAKTQ